MDKDTLRQQLLAHAKQLREAGVEWLPNLAPLEVAAAPAPAPKIEDVSSSLEIATKVSGVGGMTPDERRVALQVVADQVKGCTRCTELASTRTQTVFADGIIDPEVCFLGEAPGADEDAQGLPFVGAAGQLLNKIIAAMGFKREEVYICNILKCRPPGNRTPLPDEAAHCREYLERQLELVAPKYIVALGSCAAGNLLQTKLAVGKLRKQFHDYKGIPVVVTYHPAYLLPHRSPAAKKDVWEDMKMLLTKMGRPIPTAQQQS